MCPTHFECTFAKEMASSSGRLVGKVVFITGAAQGIGRATAVVSVTREKGVGRGSIACVLAEPVYTTLTMSEYEQRNNATFVA